jgi:ribosomal protein S18 acetylase RimI-like enzyme
MNSPVYSLERDLVVEGAHGVFAAFCIYWLDKVNRLGYFEPVGTHPDYRRQGLGAALIREGLWRIKADGMLTASVCVESDNLIAQMFYDSLGFQSIQKIHSYSMK